MGRHPTTTCKQGHPWTEKNSYYFTDKDGITRRRCSTCQCARQNAAAKLRYRHDPVWRKLIKAKALAAYYRRKAKLFNEATL
jgi:hypothetical protein